VPELRSRANRRIDVDVIGVPTDTRLLEQYDGAGVRRVVHWLPSAPRGPVERALDRWESTIAELHGE